MLRLTLMVCAAVLLSSPIFAQEAAPAPSAGDYSVQLQSLEQETQLQMHTLEAQRAEANPQEAEAIEKHIADLKFQYEIRRLSILLEQAQAEGDESRAAEIRHALDNWLKPPSPEITAPVQRSAPGTPNTPPEVHESTR
jgi:hypothetical protein